MPTNSLQVNPVRNKHSKYILLFMPFFSNGVNLAVAVKKQIKKIY